ncbi:MAG: DUF4296 domain-containing protein [Flavobacteriaceae bacterium]
MIRNLLFGLLFLSSLACSTRMVEPPERLIAKEKFVDILYELAIYNGVKNNTTPAFTTSDLQIMPYLYSKYDFDSVQFFESNFYYASRGDLYVAMYDTVRARIERTEKLLDSLREVSLSAARAAQQAED